MTQSEFLITYAPPTRLRIWLHEVFTAKKKRGEPVPEVFETWLEVWDKTVLDTESQLIDDLKKVVELAF